MDIKNENISTSISKFSEELHIPIDINIEDKQFCLRDSQDGNNFKYDKKPGIVLIGKKFSEAEIDVYLNVTANDQVSKPYICDNFEIWYIPYVIIATADEGSKNALYYSQQNVLGSICKVVNIIVNPLCLNKIRHNAKLCNAFVKLIKGIINKYIDVDVNIVEILGFDYNDDNSFFALVEDSHANLKDLEVLGSIEENDQIPIKDVKTNGNINRKEASYKIKYIYDENNIKDINHSKINIDRPHMVSLEYILPGVEYIEDIDIETDGREIKLKTKNNLNSKVKMDFPVFMDPVKSTFSKDKNFLHLEFKVNDTAFQKINLAQIIKGECAIDIQSDLKQQAIDKPQYVLPEYKIIQSMTEYVLTIFSCSMIKGSLKHTYIGNNTLDISFNKNGSASLINCRLIFDAFPRKLNCAKSFLNQSKRTLIFTIKKLIPKISIKAKVGPCYDCLEEVKILYSERKHCKKRGKQSEWIQEFPERIRSLSESSAYTVEDDNYNSLCRSQPRQHSFSNYFLTSSWPKGILKRYSNSESTYSSPQDVFENFEYDKESRKFGSRQSLDSSVSLYTSSSDSACYLSGVESSLDDLSIESSSPQKKVVFSDVILKEVYKASSSIVGKKNRTDYLRKRPELIRKLNSEAQKESNDLPKEYTDSFSDNQNIDLYNTIPYTVKQNNKKIKKKKAPLQQLDKEDLIFSFDDH